MGNVLNFRKFTIICMVVLNLSLYSKAASSGAIYPEPVPIRFSLNGECAFAADYAGAGEQFEWFSEEYNDDIWDRVTIPHVWSLDPRYPYYEGAAWYRKTFTLPLAFEQKHIRLVFEAVFSSSVVWLNGRQVAVHEGGYTPFEIDVTPYVYTNKPNLLVVKADNRLKRKPHAVPQLVRAWMEDGGIIRDVYLEATTDVFIANQKITTEPDLQTGRASVNISVWVSNTRKEAVQITLRGRFSKENALLDLEVLPVTADIPAQSVKRVEIIAEFLPDMVQLWSLDRPVLYSLTTFIDGIATANPVHFGIRKFQVRNTELLLNGYPVRLAGANRVASGLDFGQNDPAEWVEKDLRLMKEAGLEMMRMHHVPLSRAVLDWADRHGMLLIEECAMPTNLFSEEATALDRQNLRAMIERDWNRPSIVAWSIGNEYESETPEGFEWSRKMREYVLSIDSSRLICFASNRAAKRDLNPEQEASSLMDVVCLNTYGASPEDNADNIDMAHRRWPDKPLIVTEYGYRADRVGREEDRQVWFEEMFRIFRERPFLSGASLWSFNDYRSRYVSTNPDGYRWWGLVDAARNTRGSYELFKREMTPVILKEARISGDNLVVLLAGRADFPIYPPTECRLNIRFYNFRGREIDNQTRLLDPIAPGEQKEVIFSMKSGVSYFRGEFLRGDFSMQIFGPTTWRRD